MYLKKEIQYITHQGYIKQKNIYNKKYEFNKIDCQSSKITGPQLT